MIFNHVGKAIITEERIKETEHYFLNYLGDFKDEFEQLCQIVQVNHDESSNSSNFYTFPINDPTEMWSFFNRFNASKKQK
jgi:hypothetical protein